MHGRDVAKISQSNTNYPQTVCHNLAEGTEDTVGTEEDIPKLWEYEWVTPEVVYQVKEGTTTTAINSFDEVRVYCDKELKIFKYIRDLEDSKIYTPLS